MNKKKDGQDGVPIRNTTGVKALNIRGGFGKKAGQVEGYQGGEINEIPRREEPKRGMSVVEGYEKIEESDAELQGIPEEHRKLLTKGSKQILVQPPKSEEQTFQQIFDQGKNDYQDCPLEKRASFVEQYIRLKNFPESYKWYFGGLGIRAFQEALKHPEEIKPLLKAALLFRKSEIYHFEVEQSLRQILNEKKEKMSDNEKEAMKVFLRNYNPEEINERYSKIRADISFFLGQDEQKDSGLVKKLPLVIAGISFFGSLLFLSSNFTGFAVSNTSSNNLLFIGGFLFLISIVAFMFYRRKID